MVWYQRFYTKLSDKANFVIYNRPAWSELSFQLRNSLGLEVIQKCKVNCWISYYNGECKFRYLNWIFEWFIPFPMSNIWNLKSMWGRLFSYYQLMSITGWGDPSNLILSNSHIIITVLLDSIVNIMTSFRDYDLPILKQKLKNKS